MQLGQWNTLYLKLKNPAEAELGDLYTVSSGLGRFSILRAANILATWSFVSPIVEVIQVDKALTTVRAIRNIRSGVSGRPGGEVYAARRIGAGFVRGIP